MYMDDNRENRLGTYDQDLLFQCSATCSCKSMPTINSIVVAAEKVACGDVEADNLIPAGMRAPLLIRPAHNIKPAQRHAPILYITTNNDALARAIRARPARQHELAGPLVEQDARGPGPGDRDVLARAPAVQEGLDSPAARRGAAVVCGRVEVRDEDGGRARVLAPRCGRLVLVCGAEGR